MNQTLKETSKHSSQQLEQQQVSVETTGQQRTVCQTSPQRAEHEKPSYGTSKSIVVVALAAALYAAVTIFTMFFLQGLSWGPIQLRIGEALNVLALVSPVAPIGLALGCAISNLVLIAFGGVGILGVFDFVLGSLATFLGAIFVYRFRANEKVALLGPILANALVVPAYLPIILQGLGFYSIPLTGITIEGIYPLMYAFGFVSIAISQSIVVYGLGLPLLRLVRKIPMFKKK